LSACGKRRRAEGPAAADTPYALLPPFRFCFPVCRFPGGGWWGEADSHAGGRPAVGRRFPQSRSARRFPQAAAAGGRPLPAGRRRRPLPASEISAAQHDPPAVLADQFAPAPDQCRAAAVVAALLFIVEFAG